MSVYLDTSVLVGMFALEPDSPEIFVWLNQNSPKRPTISSWNMTEFSAALTFKQNLGALDGTERHAILRDFRAAQGSLFDVIGVANEDFNRAATFANQIDLRLRGSDALHLSIASGNGLAILTLDKRMNAAAKMLGIALIELD